MKVYSGAGLGDIYFALIRDITEFGRKITTRGQTCLELPEPVCLEYHRPGACWMRIPGRKFNPFFALAEVVWILSGNGNVEWISYFNKQMREYADEGKEDFHGSYGLRIRKWPSAVGNVTGISVDQILCVVNKLKKDSFSRQAVISLWDPELDNVVASKDYPCNNIVYYSLRNEILEQTVVIRSNDAIWGTPVNAIQFTHLHALVAGMLGVAMGKLTYVIQNMHYYLDLYKPTLSNVIEKAYESRIQAEMISSFDTVDEYEFEECRMAVGAILAAKNKGMIASLAAERVGYWGHVIPRMVLIYTAIKEDTVKTERMTEMVIDSISSLGQPLVDLIVDFYKDSKIPSAQKVLQLLQERMEA